MFELMLDSRRRELFVLLEDRPVLQGADLERIEAARKDRRAVAQTSAGLGVVKVVGPLVPSADRWLDYFDIQYTAYTDLIEDLKAAEASGAESVVLSIDSPGGSVNGFFTALDAIKAVQKPVVARVEGMAASAAYGIASQADNIELTHRSNAIGSVGVATSAYVSGYVVDITSTEAPDKRPDASTEEGQAVIRKELDQYHDLFVEYIAEGRGTTVETVNANYGRGAVMLGDKAIACGLVDCMQSELGKIEGTNAAKGADVDNFREECMDIQELQAEHPSLYAEALKIGAEKEADRVKAHVTMGKASGAKDLALENIESGIGLTDSVRAGYEAARMKSVVIAENIEGDEAVAGADDAEQAPSADAESERGTNHVLGSLGA